MCPDCVLVAFPGILFLFSVSGLLCQLFILFRSQCELWPIPIFLVMLLNCSCHCNKFCTKYVISDILAQWRLVSPENTVLKLCLNVSANVSIE